MSNAKFQSYANQYPAMFKWCQREYSNNPGGLFLYIVEAIAAGPDDCVFFDMFIDAENDMRKLVELILSTNPEE